MDQKSYRAIALCTARFNFDTQTEAAKLRTVKFHHFEASIHVISHRDECLKGTGLRLDGYFHGGGSGEANNRVLSRQPYFRSAAEVAHLKAEDTGQGGKRA